MTIEGQVYIWQRVPETQDLGEPTNSLIGRGLSFPFAVDEFRGTLDTNIGAAQINSQIHHLLSFHAGERFFRPKFFSRLHSIIFEPWDEITKTTLTRYVIEDILNWISVIEVVLITYDEREIDQNTVKMDIEYRITPTNFTHHFVYPFKVNTHATNHPSDSRLLGV